MDLITSLAAADPPARRNRTRNLLRNRHETHKFRDTSEMHISEQSSGFQGELNFCSRLARFCNFFYTLVLSYTGQSLARPAILTPIYVFPKIRRKFDFFVCFLLFELSRSAPELCSNIF